MSIYLSSSICQYSLVSFSLTIAISAPADSIPRFGKHLGEHGESPRRAESISALHSKLLQCNDSNGRCNPIQSRRTNGIAFRDARDDWQHCLFRFRRHCKYVPINQPTRLFSPPPTLLFPLFLLIIMHDIKVGTIVENFHKRT